MVKLLANPPLAGAIFTDEQIKIMAAIAVVILIVGLVALYFFLRSCYRLVTRKEKAASDIAIVMVGFLLLMPAGLGRVEQAFTQSQRLGQEETAMRLINDVTNRTADEFDVGRWNDFQACSFFKVDVSGMERAYRSPEQLLLNNETVRTEAALFEAAGWDVARYAAIDPESSAGLAFRADLDEHAIMLYNWGGLGYGYLDSDCWDKAGNLQTGRVEVSAFPPA